MKPITLIIPAGNPYDDAADMLVVGGSDRGEYAPAQVVIGIEVAGMKAM